MTEQSNRAQPGRVMVVALDGATWDLARPWMQSGAMPNLARVVQEGVTAGMQAELPPSSVPNWPAFMTGKNAGKHGCVWWLKRDAAGYPDRVPIDARSVCGDTIWSYLSALDRRVIVQNVPVTYPVEPVNGVMISGLLTPRTADDFIYPPDLKPEIDRVTGGYQIYPQEAFAHGREKAFVDGQIANIRQHAQAAEYLLRNEAWDFFIIVLGPTDEAAHKVWHLMDESHSLHPRSNGHGGELANSLQRIYTAADEAIGKLAANLGENDTLIVMSDHGFGPVERFFHVNNWLMQAGYLRLKRSGATRVKSLLFRAGFSMRNIYPIGKQVLSLIRGTGALRQRLDPGRQGSKSPLRKVFLSPDDIDWSQTRAIASGFLYGQVYINLRGRDPEGIVSPDEYEPLRDQLIRELSQVVDPATGKRHYDRVCRREEVYSGPFLAEMPDLLCVPADLRTADSGMGFRSNRLFDTDNALTGTHREMGIFAMRGPGVQRGVEVSPIRIQDLKPTILYSLDLPIPDDLDGKVIAAAFEPQELAARQVQVTPALNTRAEMSSALSSDDEESIKKRLRDLGYLA